MARTVLDGAWEVVDEWATSQEPRTEIFELSFYGGHDYSIDFQEGWAVAFTDKKFHVGDEVVAKRKYWDTLKNTQLKGDGDEYLIDFVFVEFNRISKAGHHVFKVVEINPSPRIEKKILRKWTTGNMYKFLGDGWMEHDTDWYMSVRQANELRELTVGEKMNESCKNCRFVYESYHCISCSEFDGRIEDCKSFCPYCTSNYGDDRCNNCIWFE